MITRRKFVINSILASTALAAGVKGKDKNHFSNNRINKPVVISTWDHGIPANEEAWKILGNNGRALDAVEAGVKISEADPKVSSVGYGGLPDRDGNVTLDACIIDENGNAGSVAFLEHIMHPISVARLVMEKTPHVMLAGEGALKFALDNGFKKENLLTDEAKKAWENWLKESKYKPAVTKDNHDTIGMVALDMAGNVSGACTTSGLGFKMRGRVGDSPIIGAGLFVDNEAGAAAATGIGETVMRVCGSFLVVEYLRNGETPIEACKLAIERLYNKNKGWQNNPHFQVGLIALNKAGETGGYSIRKGFQYAVYQNGKNELVNTEYLIK